jgi:hypothetical protein
MTQAMACMTNDSKLRSVTIAGMLYFSVAPSADKVENIITEKIFSIPRMRSCLVDNPDSKDFFIKERADVKLEHHFEVIDRTTEQKDVDAIIKEAYVGTITPNSCPSWKIYLFTNCNIASHRGMMVFLCDHALVDGSSAIAMLLSLLDEGEQKVTGRKPRRATPRLSPLLTFRAFMAGFRQGALGPLLPADPPTLFKITDHRNPGIQRNLFATESLDLNKIKYIKNKYEGATVTDVMLAILTVTIAKYFKSIGESTKSIRANFPVDMRPRGTNALDQMGNKFASGIIAFDLDYKDVSQVVYDVVYKTQMVKNSPAMLMENALLGKLVPFLVKRGAGGRRTLLDVILDVYGKVTMMLSSNMGPQEESHFAGEVIEDLKFYALTPLGAYAGIISYNGKVSCGFVLDSECGDPEKLSSFWRPAFEEIYNVADEAKGMVPLTKSLSPPVSMLAVSLFILALGLFFTGYFKLGLFVLFSAVLAWA